MITGKGRGPYLAGVRRRLLKAGLSNSVVLRAMLAVRGTTVEGRVKIPREVVARISQALSTEKRVVVSRGRSGKFRVYSYEGHAASVQSARKTKPWERRANNGPRLEVAS